ncbi:MAG: dihydroorotate dehydrogenase [Paracoccaceae bacterium]|nr:dihydroorotate dehydrogenase [Paracoccaceae bacterium]
MIENRDRDDGLEAFFDDARAHKARPDSALKARLLEDALAHQPAPAAVAPARRGRLGSAIALLGGWPALTGLATATVAGVWIGVAQPTAVGDLAFGTLSGGEDYSGFMPGYGLEFGDG